MNVNNPSLLLAFFKSPANLVEAIRQRGLAVVNVRDDAEIADILLLHGGTAAWNGKNGREV